MVALGNLLTLWCLGLTLLPGPWQELLSLNRHGQWWQLWSSHWVHYGVGHALVNGGAIFVLCRLLAPSWSSWKMTFLLLAWSGAASWALLAWDDSLIQFRGASGVASLLLMLFCLDHLYADDALVRWSTRLALFFWLFHLISEMVAIPILPSSLPSGVTSSWPIHLLAALGGTLIWWGSQMTRDQDNP